MIVTPYFVFIHLHKTGGQFINKALLEYIPESKNVGYHYPRKLLPIEHQNKPVVGLVRNPWDWYVSWYSFNQQRATGNIVYNILSNNNQLDFNTVIERLLFLGDEKYRGLREKIIMELPESIVGNRGIGLTKSCLVPFDTGFFTWQYQRMFSLNDTSNDVIFGKVENLRDDFLRILKELNVLVTEQLASYIKKAEPLNVSERRGYQEYYNDALKKLVGERDKEIISRFNYSF